MESRRAEVNRVCIVKAEAVTALGNSLDDAWNALLAGKSGVRPTTRFSTDKYKADAAACIPDLSAGNETSLIYPLIERISALMGKVPPDCRLIAATTKAGIDALETWRRKGQAGSLSALPFLYSEFLAAVSKSFDLSGKAENISAACASGTIAVKRAAAAIASGRNDAVLVCCMDLVSEFVFSGFSALHALSPGQCRPFDVDRSGLSLGEGAAALLIMSEKRARREKLKPLAFILGWAEANDANHVTAPARDGCGLIKAVNLALEKAALTPGDIAAVSAHGTGTVYNDAMELTAFKAVFGERPVSIHSIKGAIGHTLGAAGGIETAVAAKALQAQTTPPTTGLKNPEKRAEAMASAKPAPFSGDYILKTNSGFGGINAAIILGKAQTS